MFSRIILIEARGRAELYLPMVATELVFTVTVPSAELMVESFWMREVMVLALVVKVETIVEDSLELTRTAMFRVLLLPVRTWVKATRGPSLMPSASAISVRREGPWDKLSSILLPVAEMLNVTSVV